MYMCVGHSHKEQCKTLSQPYSFSRYKYWSTDTNVGCTDTAGSFTCTCNTEYTRNGQFVHVCSLL